MSPYESIPNRPDRDTDAHARTLLAKAHTDDGALRVMDTGNGEWIESDTYRANYR